MWQRWDTPVLAILHWFCVALIFVTGYLCVFVWELMQIYLLLKLYVQEGHHVYISGDNHWYLRESPILLVFGVRWVTGRWCGDVWWWFCGGVSFWSPAGVLWYNLHCILVTENIPEIWVCYINCDLYQSIFVVSSVTWHLKYGCQYLHCGESHYVSSYR